MSRLTKIYAIIGSNPLIAIEFLVSLGLLIIGVYFLTPLYVPAENSVLFNFLNTPLVNRGIGLLYVLAGVLGLVGVHKNSLAWRNISTYFLFAACIFTATIRVLTLGPAPIVWVWPLLLGLIFAIANLSLRWKQSSD